jgi:hypothetical protein
MLIFRQVDGCVNVLCFQETCISIVHLCFMLMAEVIMGMVLLDTFDINDK